MKTTSNSWPAMLAILACLSGVIRVEAQEVRRTPSVSMLPALPDGAGGLNDLLPTQPPSEMPAAGELRPLRLADPKTSREVAAMVEGLKGNDASFEVVVGQARILSLKIDIVEGKNQPLIAVGDPSVIDFTLINPRQLRISGRRVGVTDLSIASGQGTTLSFEVRVVADLDPLRTKIGQSFPDAHVELSQLRNIIVVEGQARDVAQAGNIMVLVSSYMKSIELSQTGRGGSAVTPIIGAPGAAGQKSDTPPAAPMPVDPTAPTPPGMVVPEGGGSPAVSGPVAPSQILNLIRVPNSQQVLLKVRVAELNRSSMRQIGSNFLGVDPRTGSIVGSNIAGQTSATGNILPSGATTSNSAGAMSVTSSAATAKALTGNSSLSASTASTIFGIFQNSNFEFTLNALRENGVLKILAEPNLVALHGQRASFLAGGQFPVPVPQVSAAGSAPTVTVQFKNFGVSLDFLPFIMDNDVVRLSVAPVVSNIDQSVAVTLVAGGSPVPGLNVRQASTTVELKQGQTLAIAGLLQLQLNANTARIPILGDLPILGPFFSNTTSQRTEKELVVLVTPYLVEPMNADQVGPTPDENYKEPNDLEFYFLNRIEARTGRDWRSTVGWSDPLNLARFLKLEKKYVHGASGFSD